MIDFYRFKHLSDASGCIHAVTMRADDAPCDLSLALHTGEPASQIVANRRRIALELDPQEQMCFVLADQTHSDHIRIVTETESRGWDVRESAIPDTDALITDRKGMMLGILTADCVPILLYDPVLGVVAAVHAGWKGTRAQIVAKCVGKMMEHFGCNPSDILAGVGPAIGSCCYEVGAEVAEHFLDIEGSAHKRGEKYMLDLSYINKYQLIGAGLAEAQIEMSGICTACDTDHFFSYRKEQGCSGRFLSLIGIVP